MATLLGVGRMARDPRPTARATAPDGRVAYLDNAKFLAIVLVVVGHAWTDLRGHPAIDAAYTFVYLFHIAVFVMLAGYLSRSFRLTGRSFLKLCAALLIPYVLFETTYEAVTALVEGRDAVFNATAPSWVMWFLPALFLWRLSVPLFRRLPPSVAVTLAVAVSLLGGWSSEDDYAWAKTLSLLPFFVFGLVLRRETLTWVRRTPVRVVAGLIAVATATYCVVAASWFDIGLTRWKYSYDELGFGPVDGPAARLAMIAVAGVLAICFLSLVPAGRRWYSSWGENTMYSYLLHGFAIQAAIGVGIYAAAWSDSTVGVLVLSALAVVVAVGLMAPVVPRLFRGVVEPWPRGAGDDDLLDRLWSLPIAEQRTTDQRAGLHFDGHRLR